MTLGPGWTCALCGMWVPNGGVHYCSTKNLGTGTVRWTPVPSDAAPHEHHWQPAGFVSARKSPNGLHQIYALCPCGKTRKFEVKP